MNDAMTLTHAATASRLGLRIPALDRVLRAAQDAQDCEAMIDAMIDAGQEARRERNKKIRTSSAMQACRAIMTARKEARAKDAQPVPTSPAQAEKVAYRVRRARYSHRAARFTVRMF